MRPLLDEAISTFAHIRYVLTDVDDTLTFRGKLSAETYNALERLRDAGLRLIPVTAAPAGWCDLMVRMWPIDAVIGENGGFYSVERSGTVERVFWLDDIGRKHSDKFLQGLKEQIARLGLPVKLSADQPFRLTSVSWDRPDEQSTTFDVLTQLRTAGASATANSIWIIAWMGGYTKLSMAKKMMSETFKIDIDNALDQVLYIGDSLNDEPMFKHFPYSVGVSTVIDDLPLLKHAPHWVTKGAGGRGFVELANAIIASKR